MTLLLNSNSNGSGSISVNDTEILTIGTDGTVSTITVGGTNAVATVPVLTTGPAFSASISTTTTLPLGAYTKVNYATEDYDTDNCYNPTTSTFTPNMAGYYSVSAQAQNGATSILNLVIYKNGVIANVGEYDAVTGGNRIKCVNGTVYLNGTTDYIDIRMYSSVASTVITTNGSGTKFTAHLVKSA